MQTFCSEQSRVGIAVPSVPFCPPQRSIVLLLLSGLFVVGVGGCASETNKDSKPDQPPYALEASLTDSSVALVIESRYGRDTVRASAYQNRLTALREDEEREVSSIGLHETAVRGYALRHVMVGEAQERGTEIDSSRLARRMRARRQGYEDRTAFQQALAEQGGSIDSLRTREANTLRVEQLQSTFAENAAPPTDPEVRAFRREQRQKEVRLRYILFQTDPDSSGDVPPSAEKKARMVLDSAKAGTSFSALARRHSDSPTAEIGGLMPQYQPIRQLNESIAEPIRTLQDSGEVARSPVRTPRGIHLIQLVDRQTSSPSEGEARWRLLSERRRRAIRDAQRSVLEAAEVKPNPEIVQTGSEARGD